MIAPRVIDVLGGNRVGDLRFLEPEAAFERVARRNADEVGVAGEDVFVPVREVPEARVDHTLDAAPHGVGDRDPAALQLGAELQAAGRQRPRVVDAERQRVFDSDDVGVVGADPDRRFLVQEVRLVFLPPCELKVDTQLVAWRAELVRQIDVGVREPGPLVFPPEPEPLALSRRLKDERYLRDVDVMLVIVDARDGDGVRVVQGKVGPASDGVDILLAVFRHLGLNHAAIVIEARGEFIVRQPVLQQQLSLNERARPRRAVVQVHARDHFLVVREAAEIGRKVAPLLGELADAQPKADIAGPAKLLFLLVNDVDDARHACGVEARRGVVDDFNRLDVGRRHAVQPALSAESGQARLPPIDQDGDLVAAAQRDLSLLIDRHTRDVLQRVEDRPGGLRGSLVETKHLGVDAGGADRLRRDRHLFLESLEARKTDVAEVVGLIQWTDDHVRLGFEEAGKRDPDSILARRQTLYDEAAVLAGQRTPDGRRSGCRGGALDGNGRKTDRCVTLQVEYAPGKNGGSLGEDQGRKEQERGKDERKHAQDLMMTSRRLILTFALAAQQEELQSPSAD